MRPEISRALGNTAAISVAFATMLLMALTLAACGSNPPPATASSGGSLAASRSDLGAVPNRMSAGRFKSLDKNNDGFLTLDEVEGPLALYFGDLDKNRDGKLSPDEVGVRP
jgi:EF hand domain-containing protein